MASALVVGALCLVVSACSGSGTTASGDSASIGVTTSSMFVTIENKAGLPLLDVSVSIIPVGRATEYTRFVGRLENAEKRDIALGDFDGKDGTPFSLRVVRPDGVHVVAKDMNSKAYEVQAPWAQ